MLFEDRVELLFREDEELLQGVYAQLTNGYWVRVFYRNMSAANQRMFITKKENDHRMKEMASWQKEPIEIIIKKEAVVSDDVTQGIQ